jgi:pimeloyl-ACP methyl ester carboxylesterase
LSEAAYLFARAARGFGHLDARGPKDGPPALVIPGFVANDRTTMELRRALAEGGWRVHPWGMGWNLGATEDIIDRLARRIEELWDGRKILVVGWSLGGIFARELARAIPDKVRAVITLGSPFSGDAHWNNVWRLYEWVAGHKVDNPPVERIFDKPPVPTLAFWSAKDGIVAIRAAKGLAGECDEAVEISCGHMAFSVSAKATRQVVREIDRFLKKYP